MVPGSARHSRQLGHLLLGQAARAGQLADGGADAFAEVARADGSACACACARARAALAHSLAGCQYIGAHAIVSAGPLYAQSMEEVMDSAFAGINAVVTGASRGLGRALAVELAGAGARVVLVARASAELDAAVAAIRDAGGVAHALAADVRGQQGLHAI